MTLPMMRTLVLVGAGLIACSSPAPQVGPVCHEGGRTYAKGASFPSADKCNTCTCLGADLESCTLRACLPGDGGDAASGDAASGSCSLNDTYHFGQDGGLVAFSDESILSPPAHYVRTRTTYRGGDGPTAIECAPPLPACGARDAISLLDITRDLADPDVVAAFTLTTAPVYGRDTRPGDGTIFFVRRADGRTIFVGPDCGAPVQNSCLAAPRGVRVLADDLSALASQLLATPACAAFR